LRRGALVGEIVVVDHGVDPDLHDGAEAREWPAFQPRGLGINAETAPP
jgi:hypothetical protein